MIQPTIITDVPPSRPRHDSSRPMPSPSTELSIREVEDRISIRKSKNAIDWNRVVLDNEAEGKRAGPTRRHAWLAGGD